MAVNVDARATLLRLSDSGLRLANDAEDIRDRKVIDSAGNDIGEIDDLIIDDQERKVRFLRLAAGGFLGLGEVHFLIPVEAITRITGDAVHIDQTHDHVARGPRYSPEVTLPRHSEDVYSHYQLAPFWSPGYLYPLLPFFPD